MFNVDGVIYATDGTCPHAGGPLGMGRLAGNVVTCSVHGLRFDVTTGCFAGGSTRGVDSYPVKIVDGKIMVRL